ncbi:Transposable element Tc1 transposase [Folsomia candida]|uniref:Transposable element Tc1 transposase n=1 Tax=Folsomia candida TaxID=158441 RepID=A0A226D7K7_FOLCA|nr:Transposable element Tc1 transposase [Folsomia candida]
MKFERTKVYVHFTLIKNMMASTRKEIPIAIRDLVIQDWKGGQKGGLSQRQIGTKYKLARTTIQTIIKNFRANGSVQNKVRSGRKPILAHPEVRHVLNKVNVTPSLSAPKLSTEIKEMFGKQSSPEASYCTEECNQTSEVCQRPHFQATNILGHILWTDESKFNVFGSDGRRRVWRYPKEALNPKNLNPTVKHGGGSVMVWGCMASRICSKTWTWTTICLPTRQRSETLCHVHHGILQEKKIPKLEWPPQSPDLNPIEHLWDHIEREIRKKSFSGIPGLKSRIREVWETISEDVTKNLRTHMKKAERPVFPCHLCPLTFYSERGIFFQVKNFHEQKKYFCTICGKNLRSAHGLRYHIRVNHATNEAPTYFCQYCEYQNRIKENLTSQVARCTWV